MRKLEVVDVECLWAELSEKKEHLSVEFLASVKQIFAIAAQYLVMSEKLTQLKNKQEKTTPSLYLVK